MRAPLLYLLFFLSGISGLVYQVVWVRQFGNLFGNTVWSAAVVTAIFMCGLGVGGLVAGRLADRLHARDGAAPLRLYARVELGIAVLGMLVALALPWVGRASGALSAYTPDAQGWLVLSVSSQVWRYLLALVLLGPITLLMGGTLTLLIRHQVGSQFSAAGWHVGALYGVNTAGAALGAFLTDLAFIPALGVRDTQLLAVALNTAVGLCALLVLRQGASSAAPPPPVLSEPAPPPSMPEESRLVHLTGMALALSGFASMGMEMLWFRYFSTLLGGFRSVFSLLLTVILVCMWLGATLAGGLVRRLGRPALLLGSALTLLVITSLGLLASLDVESVRASERALGHGGPPSRLAEHLFLLMPMISAVGLPSVLMGMTFPLANALVQRASATVGGRAGGLYLWNTAGAVLGSLCTGFLLLPALGMQRSMGALALLTTLALLPLALAAIPLPEAGLSRRRVPTLLAGCALALVGWSGQAPDKLLRQGFPIVDVEPVRVLATSEGPNETVLIAEVEGLGRALYTNGHSMAGNEPTAQRYMRAMAHVPLLQQESPRRVGIICFGAGNTVHAASLHPSVEKLDVMDLSRNVLSHADYFAATNGHVLKDPRVTVHVNDGRQHLRMRPEGTYDLITLEPPPIAFAGVGSLYSREFYALARSRLVPGGYFTQWLPAYQVPEHTSRAMVRAFLDVFPDAVLLAGYGAELILMGSNGGQNQLHLAEVQRRLEARPQVKADLERFWLGSPVEYAGLFSASTRGLEALTRGVAPVTDDWPITEYSMASTGTPRRMPAGLFALEDLTTWCTDCDDPRLPAYTDELKRLYAQEEFLSRAEFALPSPP
ncbi:fused MFS/spermidine synthase [Melittangium boletus]|uniref:Spermidine synthase n=1 Tax=Melittangium boletus DSM 14713 TaxID=1294270 RepID=A0A250IQH9_9BACT|nr:fused MFS/spermidine synthase [Melittangium boletus]ATB33421.1 spermidine synthase [Melittangium boletus DSM 14713]